MTNVAPQGTSAQNGELNGILQTFLNGMGSFLSKEIYSLAWIDQATDSRVFYTALRYIRLMANQLNPATASVYLNDYKVAYNIQGFSDIDAITYIKIQQSLFGTPPTLENITLYLKYVLGNVFIDLEWAPELQYLATGKGGSVPPNPTVGYKCPLSVTYIRIWQPRDNKDNLLMSNADFATTSSSYKRLMSNWIPLSYSTPPYQLLNFGNMAGCAAIGILTPQQCYQDGYNVINVSANSNTVIGTNTTFVSDFAGVTEGFYPPLEVVDDTNTLYTYYVSSVQSNTHLTLTQPVRNSITGRTYRTLGFISDVGGMSDFAYLHL